MVIYGGDKRRVKLTLSAEDLTHTLHPKRTTNMLSLFLRKFQAANPRV